MIVMVVNSMLKPDTAKSAEEAPPAKHADIGAFVATSGG